MPLLPALAACLALPLSSPDPSSTPSDGPDARVYRIRQTTVLRDVDVDAKTVRWWIAIPDNERHQEVLDVSVVRAPGPWRIERDRVRGNRFLYVEAQEPGTTELDAVVEFTLRREPVLVAVDPAKVGPITAEHRAFYAEEVRQDAPHMEVGEAVRSAADEVCGDDRNPATQVAKLLQHVAATADHYSKDPTKPTCGIGAAEACLTNGGGCCTDLHSLFIALARARGIPARLQMGYRLNPKNEGKEYDPGYRCWVEYFLPGHGWIPADVVEADAPDGLGPERWFTGLTEWRIWLNEGREFELRPAQAGPPVNTMVIGYAEIDGRPARVLPEGELTAQMTRRIEFVEVR